MTLFEQATNPKQYDLEGLNWQASEAANIAFFSFYLLSNKEAIEGKDVLDIGSGTGWLLEGMRKVGARSVLGIEPSSKNAEYARKLYPLTNTVVRSLEDYHTNKHYDLIVSVMAMQHIKNISLTMQKIASFLRKDGKFEMIVPSFEYVRTPRFGYEIKTEDRGDNEYVASIKRGHGTMVDVIRKPETYIKAGLAAGLQHIETIGISPTPELIMDQPKYERFRNSPISDLIVFKKD